MASLACWLAFSTGVELQKGVLNSVRHGPPVWKIVSSSFATLLNEWGFFGCVSVIQLACFYCIFNTLVILEDLSDLRSG